MIRKISTGTLLAATTRPFPIVALASLAFLICSFGFPRVGSATQFTPYRTSVCPTMTEYNFTYDSLDEVVRESEFACHYWYGANADCDRYADWIDVGRVFVANGTIDQVDFKVSDFELEDGYDYLSLFEEIGGGYSTLLTGTPTVPFWVSANSYLGFNRYGAVMRFTTDSTETKRGFRIDKIRACSFSSATYAARMVQMSPGTRYTGVLLGGGDVVYHYIPAHQSGQTLNVALWAKNLSANADFDLYAKCGANPSWSTFDHVAYTTQATEFLSIPQPDGCYGNWYIAVHSYSGSGQYDLMASYMPNANKTTLTFCTNFHDPFELDIDDIRVDLEEASRYMYGATEGQYLYDSVLLSNGGGINCENAACDICFHQEDGTSNSTDLCNGARVHIHPRPDTEFSDSWYMGKTIAHELGHAKLCLPDEYVNDSQHRSWFQCGHSMMANHLQTNNFCTVATHGYDDDPGAPGVTTSPVWWILYQAASILTYHSQEPDDYDYSGHPFAGMVESN